MSDPYKFVIPDAKESHGGKYSAVLRDENGNLITSAILTSLTLTLYELQSRVVINSRTAQNALNANQVSIDTSGNLLWVWLPADVPVLVPNRAQEEHVALFEAKWLDSQSRPRQSNHEVHMIVSRIPQLT